jgi:hypothetical protein
MKNSELWHVPSVFRYLGNGNRSSLDRVEKQSQGGVQAGCITAFSCIV